MAFLSILLSGGANSLLLSLILLFLPFSSQAAPKSGGSPQCALYEGFTDSRCLSSFNIDSSLTESKTAWVVEFYSSWCGHCHHFSPTWKKVASRVKGWSSVVRMGQIDCTHSDNRAICGLYHIQAFPTIKLFSPMIKDPHKEGIKTFLGRRSEESLLEAMIRHVESQSLVKCLEPLETKLSSTDQINVLIFEENKSLLGSEIIMDFLMENVKIRRVLPENTALSSQYSILQLPSLVILPSIPNQQHHTFIPKKEGDEGQDGTVREFFEEKIMEEVLNKKRESEKERRTAPGENERQVEASLAVNRVTMADILSTVSYCLRYEVTLKKIISGEDFYTLHQFVYHLEKVLHSLAGESRDLDSILVDLKSLYTKLSAKYSTGFMSSTDWQILLRQKLHNKTLPLKPEWKACAGSRSEFRGFPCGLWTLLHTATVVSLDTREGEKRRAAIHHREQDNLKREPKNSDDDKEDTNNNNSHNNRGGPAVVNNVISVDGSVASSREVLYSFSHFITNFFSCRSCREHFYARFKSDLLSFPLSYDGDAVMWAWAVHNDVNWRLRDDVSTDPAHPKSLFPSYKTCPYCYKKIKQSDATPTWDNIAPPVLEGIAKGQSLDMGTPPPPSEVLYEWNQTAVFIYLCHFYGHGKFDHTPHHALVRAGWPRKYPTYASDHYGTRLHGATPLSSLTLLVYLLVAAVLLAYMLNFKLKRTRFKAQ